MFQGQSKIADHLKKSYSMNDLSTDTTDGRHFRKDSLNEEEYEDEQGTVMYTYWYCIHIKIRRVLIDRYKIL